MGREVSQHATYFLQRDDCHRLDDFFEEVIANSLAATKPRQPPLALI